MQLQKSDEKSKELGEEINRDRFKAMMFPDSVMGRRRLRDMRYALYKLMIDMPIPGRRAEFTHEYCRKYADHETGDWKKTTKQRSESRFVRDWNG